MKSKIKYLSALALALGLFTAKAQDATNAPNTNAVAIPVPISAVLEFLSAGSNYFVAVYGIESQANGRGGGIALGYKLSDYIAPIMRLDYLDGTLWMPSMSLQLQYPIQLLGGKAIVIPFASPGIATPIAGKGKDNLSAVGIFTAGAAVRLDFLPWSWGKKVDLVGDVERWTGFQGLQYRMGLIYKFW